MRRGISLATFVVAMVAIFSWGTAQAERSFDVAVAHPPAPHEVDLPPFDESQRPELQVLLSSIDMTVSLIDAYGRCRDDEKSHGQCMTIIRNTLAHARTLINE
jgi:hypothetical protein